MHRAVILAVLIYLGVACCANAQVMPLPKNPPRSLGEVFTMYKELRQALDLDTKGREHYEKAEYAKAKELFLKSLEIKRKCVGDDHPLVTTGYSNLAAVYYQTGNLVRAEDNSRKFLEAMRKATPRARYPKGSEGLLKAIGNHASILESLGALIEAEQLHREALKMRRELHPEPGNLGVAINYGNIASVLFQRGEFGAAEKFARDALEASKKLPVSDENQRQLARAYGNLAETLRSQGKFDEAQENQNTAIGILRKQFPKGHPMLALAIRNLAVILGDRRLGKQALERFEEALKMAEAYYTPDQSPDGHPQTLQLLQDLGRTNAQFGQMEKADDYCKRALDMARALYSPKHFPNGHPDLSMCISNVGSVMLRGADPSRAAPLFREALAIEHNFTSRLATLLSEAEAFSFLHSRPAQLSGLLAATAEKPFAPQDYRFVWQSKSAIMRVLESRRLQILASRNKEKGKLTAEDIEIAKLSEDLGEKQRELARQLLAPAKPGHASRIEQLTAEKEDLERQLARKLHLSPKQGDPTHEDDPDALRKALPEGHVFVDFLYYLRLEPASAVFGNADRRFEGHYAAFLITRDRPVVRVELGPAERIHKAILDWREAIVAKPDIKLSENERAAEFERLTAIERALAKKVGHLVWNKVRAQLPQKKIETVYIAPDLAMTHVPFSALPGLTEEIVLQEHAVAFVPHGPFLARMLKNRGPLLPAIGSKVLVVGNVDYEKLPSAPPKRIVVSRSSAPVRNEKIMWDRLDYSKREVDRIGGLATVALKTEPDIRTDDKASVSQILLDLPGTRFAHISTHGFLADASFLKGMQIDEQMFASARNSRGGFAARNPLVLSGLVFSGANRDDIGLDRGILTAEGIISLRLEGMELATLSACSTGLGLVTGGEGILGLTRAFHIAGARNVVASLWEVDDQATGALMGLFYEYLWVPPSDKSGTKDSPLEALRQAQLYIYEHPTQIEALAKRDKNSYKVVPLPPPPQEAPAPKAPARKSSDRTRTELWAAFMLSGTAR